jgi:flagellar motility protein MotE (MotC chaperone)
MEQGEFYKEKQEIIQLKRELNEFYDKKEESYQSQKKELEDLLSTIQKEKKEIEDIKESNQKIIDEINRIVVERSILLYDKMKVKVALDIFNTMVKDGKINEVFDIMIRLKQKRQLTLLKKFDVQTKTILMEKMKNYKFEQEQKEGK